MTHRLQKTIKIVTLICIVTGFIISGYFVYNNYFKAVISVENVLSSDDPIIIELRNPSEIIRNLIAPNSLVDQLWSSPADSAAREFLEFINSSVISNTSFKSAFENHKSYLFFTNGKDEKLFPVFAMNMRERTATKILKLSFRGDPQIVLWNRIIHDFERFEVEEYRNIQTGLSVFTCITKGLWVISPSRDALENIVSRAPGTNNKDNLSNLKSIAGTDADANIYINFSRFKIQKLFPVLQGFLQNERKFGNNSVYDLNLDKNLFSLGGFTLPGKSDFIDIFSNQNPIKQEFWNILPKSCISAVSLAFDNSNRFFENQATFNRFSSKDSLNSKDFFKEIPILEAGTAWFGAVQPKQFIFIRFADKKVGIEQLRSISTNSKIDLVKVSEGLDFLTFDDLSLQSSLIKSLANGLNVNVGTGCSDFIVFSSDEETVSEVIKSSEFSSLLIHEDWFKSFTNQISESANLSVYITPAAFENMKFQISEPEYYLYRVLISTKASCLQVSGAENGFYSSLNCLTSEILEAIQIENKPDEISDSLLTTNSKSQILIPRGKIRTKIPIFVFNSDLLLSGHNVKGDQLFKIQLEEKILSEIFIVENPVRFFFNTSSKIFAVEPDGSMARGFPLDLDVKAENGIAIFDYENKKEYRLLYCGADHKVYNLDVRGEPVKGFAEVIFSYAVKQPVQHLIADKRDVLLVTDIKGNFKALNRKGEIRMQNGDGVTVNPIAGFYESFSREKGIVFTLSNENQLLFIDAGGKAKETRFKEVTGCDLFGFFNFTGDKKSEMIFVKDNTLSVFNQNFELVFSKTYEDKSFDQLISGKQKNKAIIGLFSTFSGNLFLTDENGNAFSSPVKNIDDAEIIINPDDGSLILLILKNNILSSSILK